MEDRTFTKDDRRKILNRLIELASESNEDEELRREAEAHYKSLILARKERKKADYGGVYCYLKQRGLINLD